MNERKKNGWSQEELAEQLSVSRQSISKWEGAQAIPDIQKIIKMAELFGVTTDYLLKDDMEPENAYSISDGQSSDDSLGVIRVSLEEANEYLALAEEVSPKIANGVSLCVFAPALLIFLIAVSLIPGFPLGTLPCVGIGTVSLIVLVAIAVFLFIVYGSKMQRFQYLENSPIETLYGVRGMVKEKKQNSEQSYVLTLAISICLFIIAPIPMLITALMQAPGYAILISVSVLLIFISSGNRILIRSCSMRGAYDRLLQEGDYTIDKKKKNPLLTNVSTAYWCLAAAVYLGWSFLTNDWGKTWILCPVASVFYVVVLSIVSIFIKDQKA